MAASRWLIVLLLAAALCAPGPAEASTLTDPTGLYSTLIGITGFTKRTTAALI